MTQAPPDLPPTPLGDGCKLSVLKDGTYKATYLNMLITSKDLGRMMAFLQTIKYGEEGELHNDAIIKAREMHAYSDTAKIHVARTTVPPAARTTYESRNPNDYAPLINKPAPDTSGELFNAKGQKLKRLRWQRNLT